MTTEAIDRPVEPSRVAPALAGPGGHGSRVEFADNLRGVAALLVVVSHLLGLFWFNPAGAAELVNSTPHHATVPRLVVWLNTWHVSWGPLGVAMFFLISGFVIPFSLERLSRLSFLTARALRIWPTYLIGLGVAIVVIALTSRYFGKAFPFTASDVMANMLLMQDVLSHPSIDGIAWTLQIEVRFYVVCALMAPSIVGGQSKNLLILVACFVLWIPIIAYLIDATAGLFTRHPQLYLAGFSYHVLAASVFDFAMFSFMFIGTMFHFVYRRQISWGQALFAVAFLLTATLVLVSRSTSSALFGVTALNYPLGLAIFFLAFAVRSRLGLPRVFRYIAAISYPLYVVHGVLGYAILRILTEKNVNPYLAIGCAVGASVLLATLVHVFVEDPSNRLGKRLARRIDAGLSRR